MLIGTHKGEVGAVKVADLGAGKINDSHRHAAGCRRSHKRKPGISGARQPEQREPEPEEVIYTTLLIDPRS